MRLFVRWGWCAIVKPGSWGFLGSDVFSFVNPGSWGFVGSEILDRGLYEMFRARCHTRAHGSCPDSNEKKARVLAFTDLASVGFMKYRRYVVNSAPSRRKERTWMGTNKKYTWNNKKRATLSSTKTQTDMHLTTIRWWIWRRKHRAKENKVKRTWIEIYRIFYFTFMAD